MKAATLGLALMALAALPALAGPLQSLTDRADILGYEAVGLIEVDGQGVCTGTLIAPDQVLTAAHCLIRPNDDGGLDRTDPARVRFMAGYRDGDALAVSRGARAVALVGAQSDEIDIADDVALLELEEPIPATRVAPFAVTEPRAPGQEVTVVSFGEGRMHAASREARCALIARRKAILIFDCQGSPGSSGAPIFAVGEGRPRIMSSIVGGGTYGGRDVVLGTDALRMVRSLRQALAVNRNVWPERREAPTARRMIVGDNAPQVAGSARFLRP